MNTSKGWMPGFLHSGRFSALKAEVVGCDQTDTHLYAQRPVIYPIGPNDPRPVLILKKVLNELGYPLTYNPTFGDLHPELGSRMPSPFHLYQTG